MTTFLSARVPATSARRRIETTTRQRLIGLVLVGWILRVVFSLAAQNTHHADEVFQYLEPAHRLVFGYGIIPWEYRFGVRSWLIPFFVACPLYLCKLLHVDQPAVYIPLVKCMFCLLSTSLIISSYVIGTRLVSARAGWLAAVFTCVWYELIYFSFRPYAHNIAAYFLLAALACVVSATRERSRPYVFGVCTALCALTRLQYLPVICLLLIIAARTWPRKPLRTAIATSCAVVLLAGYIDYLTWGIWFASVYYNYLFNSVYHIGLLFGKEQPPWWFLDQLFNASSGVLIIAMLSSIFFFRRLWVVLACLAVLVITHSAIPHKEYRFIFGGIPLLLILAAAVVALFLDTTRAAGRADWIPWVATAGICILSWAGILNQLPREDTVYGPRPLYHEEPQFKAFLLLAKERDLAAVFVDAVEWAHTGGYYYLHRDVPLYFRDIHFAHCGDAANYVSHMVCSADDISPPGFVSVARLDSLLVVRKQTKAGYRHVRGYSRNVLQPGVDDKYAPAVHPFLHTDEFSTEAFHFPAGR